MARKFCGEMVRLKKNYLSEVGGWIEDDEWGSTEYKVARRKLLLRGTMGLAVKAASSSNLEVLIDGELWPVARTALVPCNPLPA